MPLSINPFSSKLIKHGSFVMALAVLIGHKRYNFTLPHGHVISQGPSPLKEALLYPHDSSVIWTVSGQKTTLTLAAGQRDDEIFWQNIPVRHTADHHSNFTSTTYPLDPLPELCFWTSVLTEWALIEGCHCHWTSYDSSHNELASSVI